MGLADTYIPGRSSVIFCIICLTAVTLDWKKYFLSLIALTVAVYSFGSGLVLIPLGALILSVRLFKRKHSKNLMLLIWTLISAILVITYFSSFSSASSSSADDLVNLKPFGITVLYTCLYRQTFSSLFRLRLGMLISFFSVMSFTSFSLYIYFHRFAKFRSLLPFITLAVYSIGNAVITGLGRGGAGFDKAIAPRYITISNLFWVGFLVISFIFLKIIFKGRKNLLTKNIPNLFLLFFFLLSVRSSFSSLREYSDWNMKLLTAKKYLNQGSIAEAEKCLLYQKGVLAGRLEFLRQHKLSIYRFFISGDGSEGSQKLGP